VLLSSLPRESESMPQNQQYKYSPSFGRWAFTYFWTFKAFNPLVTPVTLRASLISVLRSFQKFLSLLLVRKRIAIPLLFSEMIRASFSIAFSTIWVAR